MMTVPTTPDNNVIFAARLTPYRSMGVTGFRILMGVVGIVCLGIGLTFALLGVWPVLGFMGLDILLIYWAFRTNFRDGRKQEDIEISREHVLLRKTSPDGKVLDYQFPQFGTRFEVDRHNEIGITDMRIANRKKHVSFGYFLNPVDRETFSDAFGAALSQAKR